MMSLTELFCFCCAGRMQSESAMHPRTDPTSAPLRLQALVTNIVLVLYRVSDARMGAEPFCLCQLQWLAHRLGQLL